MRIGPGGGGSSRFARDAVSYSRIQPPQRLVAVERGDDRRELGAFLAAGQCDAQRAQVTADRLQLAQERARRLVVDPAVRALAQLAEARERLRRVDLRRLCVQYRVDVRA